MKKIIKIPFLIAATLLLVGILVCSVTLIAVGGNLSKLNGTRLTKKSQTVSESFHSVSIDTELFDVKVLPSTDDTYQIDYAEGDKISFDIEVKEGVLTVVQKDSRKWYEYIGFHWTSADLIVRIPNSEYTDITVTSAGGDVYLASFTQIQNLTVKTKSGDIDLLGVNAQTLYAKSSSGDVELTSVRTTGLMRLQSSSGDIEFEACDGGDIEMKTSSGDVEGTFLTGKTFDVSTGSGDEHYPQNSIGAPCKITTKSGDVEIRVIG